MIPSSTFGLLLAFHQQQDTFHGALERAALKTAVNRDQVRKKKETSDRLTLTHNRRRLERSAPGILSPRRHRRAIQTPDFHLD